jgi:hypothetical protein
MRLEIKSTLLNQLGEVRYEANVLESGHVGETVLE